MKYQKIQKFCKICSFNCRGIDFNNVNGSRFLCYRISQNVRIVFCGSVFRLPHIKQYLNWLLIHLILSRNVLLSSLHFNISTKLLAEAYDQVCLLNFKFRIFGFNFWFFVVLRKLKFQNIRSTRAHFMNILFCKENV